MTQCDLCATFCAELCALPAARGGAEITVEAALHVLGGWDDDRALLVTFDGGARAVPHGDGRRAAGAGAILWGAADALGVRHRLAHTTLALPGVPHAQEAEAAGCGAALGLLLEHRGAGPRRAIVSGDNLAVIRFGAGFGRLARPEMFLRLSQFAAALLARGWVLTWRAVRRRLNEAADELATLGVGRAGALPPAAGDVADTQVWPAAFADDQDAPGYRPGDEDPEDSGDEGRD